jgi:hypothetical protein
MPVTRVGSKSALRFYPEPTCPATRRVDSHDHFGPARVDPQDPEARPGVNQCPGPKRTHLQQFPKTSPLNLPTMSVTTGRRRIPRLPALQVMSGDYRGRDEVAVRKALEITREISFIRSFNYV